MSRRSIQPTTASVFVRNLNLLGFEPPLNSKWVVNEQTFTINANSVKAFEQISHFLFHLLDERKTRTTFMGVWPVTDLRRSHEYRRLAFQWLKDIQPGTRLMNVPLRKSYFTDCHGEPFNKIVSAFTALVVDQQLSNNKDVAMDGSSSTGTTQYPKPSAAGKRSTTHRPLTNDTLLQKKTKSQPPVDLLETSLDLTPPSYPRALSPIPALQQSSAFISPVPSSPNRQTPSTCKSRFISSEKDSLSSSSLSSPINAASSTANNTPPSSTGILSSSNPVELASTIENHLPPVTEYPLSPSVEAPPPISPALESVRFSSFIEKIQREELVYKKELARRDKERYTRESLERNRLLLDSRSSVTDKENIFVVDDGQSAMEKPSHEKLHERQATPESPKMNQKEAKPLRPDLSCIEVVKSKVATFNRELDDCALDMRDKAGSSPLNMGMDVKEIAGQPQHDETIKNVGSATKADLETERIERDLNQKEAHSIGDLEKATDSEIIKDRVEAEKSTIEQRHEERGEHEERKFEKRIEAEEAERAEWVKRMEDDRSEERSKRESEEKLNVMAAKEAAIEHEHKEYVAQQLEIISKTYDQNPQQGLFLLVDTDGFSHKNRTTRDVEKLDFGRNPYEDFFSKAKTTNTDVHKSKNPSPPQVKTELCTNRSPSFVDVLPDPWDFSSPDHSPSHRSPLRFSPFRFGFHSLDYSASLTDAFYENKDDENYTSPDQLFLKKNPESSIPGMQESDSRGPLEYGRSPTRGVIYASSLPAKAELPNPFLDTNSLMQPSEFERRLHRLTKNTPPETGIVDDIAIAPSPPQPRRPFTKKRFEYAALPRTPLKEFSRSPLHNAASTMPVVGSPLRKSFISTRSSLSGEEYDSVADIRLEEPPHYSPSKFETPRKYNHEHDYSKFIFSMGHTPEQ
ncbi:HAUS augmin-like complex subunit 6 N-terminus-domain-containing protein [Mucor mucedo]|uniref:HAUS augmin-like complex subunit 6 N-terminus-domain-containing protein n=1 Tax=Mucor mucedo TaxID=29922 RepID=UPI00221F78FC|nr:HAUS augmin-like complex subunit 6 N-terminus-domain-containing protein [Mucor mucedo]KAI7893012.1 HAUS augmin-like complex subunit 6 N-terminus-domain-containing protein [Mucor mucedo]